MAVNIITEHNTGTREIHFPVEFPISKKTRDCYQFDRAISDLYSVRILAQKMNEQRDLIRNPEQVVRAGHLNAMELINEVWHYVAGKYRQDKNPGALKKGLAWLRNQFGHEPVNQTILKSIEEFPPLTVYHGKQFQVAYLEGETEGTSHLQMVLEKMICLYLTNNNPAFAPFLELFNDVDIKKTTAYSQNIDSLIEYFQTQPTFGPEDQSLIDLLKTPVRVCPYSLTGQLRYIIDHWGSLLSRELLSKILLALDLIKEEDKFHAMGPGPTLVPDFKIIDTGLGPEYERFSPDADWMPRVVLIAKNVYVWLHQLAKKYGRAMTRLDHIPDEELDTLARWGFTGLWLIGLWERSPASQKIKQWTGNPEAVSSAYSLYDYTIAEDLGGERAFINLRDRAWRRGIRLASDMVPNHTGIYSKWTIEHPDWFIQLNYSPFPSYRFTGGNLSSDDRVGVYIEDGYWDRRDAAVVFKRVDHWTGEERYIYHGNDGTHMPWNDTAQLNFLLPYVREAVIQTILHVARRFPIIRFDAAMTLAKKHYQRLWFPQPGTGGDIPSRAEHGMSKEEFDRLFPNEFWREVVDRVAKEVPDTLLLAEAFWLMEGYFVRTLGMHRVYNSAFMNMLKMEENSKYRSVIKNVLEFNPEILKRFVNFMNNPDEETAVAQFGKDDKYFGVLLMMVTMPGLPMFGHGQIEGFTEKYGMEYKRSYWEEEVDWNLVGRHEREIFPLMKKRHLFSGVENFLLYDFYNEAGYVNEDVFCYSNRCGDERSLIFYHNKFETAKGWVKTSSAISVEDGAGGRKLIQKGLAEGLGLKTDDPYYYIFRDHKSGLEYIRQGKEMAQKGLYAELEAFKYHIFLDFREIYDSWEGYYAKLCWFLNGRGVPSIEEAAIELYLAPIQTPFKEMVNPYTLRGWASLRRIKQVDTQAFEDKTKALFSAIRQFAGGVADMETVLEHAKRVFLTILQLERLDSLYQWPESTRYKAALEYLGAYMPTSVGDSLPYWRILLIWQATYGLGRVKFDEWRLGKIIRSVIQELGTDEWRAWREELLLNILTDYYDWAKDSSRPKQLARIKDILKDPDVQGYIHLNRYEGVLYFHKESFEELIYWLFVVSTVDFISRSTLVEETIPAGIVNRYEIVREFIQAAEKAGYRMEAMLGSIAYHGEAATKSLTAER
ncbi:MAG: alpha-amylase family glycosyl hydrolase [bacterium]